MKLDYCFVIFYHLKNTIFIEFVGTAPSLTICIQIHYKMDKVKGCSTEIEIGIVNRNISKDIYIYLGYDFLLKTPVSSIAVFLL